MAIQTKSCIVAIVAVTGVKQPWKRRAKNKVSTTYPQRRICNEDFCTLREFTNKNEPDKIAFVWATEHQVLEVEVETLDDANKARDPNQQLDLNEGYELVTVPLVKHIDEYDDDDKETFEDQDAENFDIISTQGSILTADFGGDWQESLTADFRVMVSKRLYVDFKTVKEYEE